MLGQRRRPAGRSSRWSPPALHGRDGALVEAARRVGDDQLRVDLHPGAEAGARRAGAERAVERERARLELLEGEVVVGQARCSENVPLAVRVVLGQVDEVEDDQAAGRAPSAVSTESVSRRLADCLTGSRSTTTSIVCFSCFLSVGGSASGTTTAVDPRAAVALGLQLAEQVDVLALALRG